jgi:type II secretory pathway pseudopilin PulG
MERKQCTVKKLHFRGGSAGSSIIEVLVAIVVMLLVMTAVLQLSVVSMRHQRVSSARSVGTQLASEGIEWVRSLRDVSGWQTFSEHIGNSWNFCLMDTVPPASEFLTLSSNICIGNTFVVSGVTYERLIQINKKPGVDGYDVAITVSWVDGSQNYEVRQQTELWKW